MPGYGVTRGNGYSPSEFEYNPLRGNNHNQNKDNYSALYYKSKQSNHQQPPHPNHHTRINHTSSLRSGSVSNNLSSNPYLALNSSTAHILPDLTIPHRRPQLLSTPQRRTAAATTQPTDHQHETKENSKHTTNGWNLSAFGFIKSAWSKLIGTPSKKRTASTATTTHKCMSQPPPPRPAHNPYAFTPSKPPINHNTNPVTPPSQTRPSMADLITQTRTQTEHKNDPNHPKTQPAKNDASTVISIHNLLQKTKLSPDDAAWLHSKIDAVTHDKYDGSLSYIGPMPHTHTGRERAASQSLIQHLNFDDSATDNSCNTNNIYSPLRPSSASHHSIIPSSIPCSRYMPHPGGFHKKKVDSSRTVRPPLRRKRPRREVFDDEEDTQSHSQLQLQSQARKRIRLAKSAYASRRFKDNYLRPINSLHSAYTIVPKYHERHGHKVEPEAEEKQKERKKVVEVEVDRKVAETELSEQQNENVNVSESEKNGFCFAGSTQIVSMVNLVDDKMNGNGKRSKSESLNINGFGSHTQSEETSEEISENIMMSDGNSKVVEDKMRSQRRSPLRDKKIEMNNAPKISVTDEDNDDKMKDKLNDEEDLKKEKNKSPSESESAETSESADKSENTSPKTSESPNKPLKRKHKNKKKSAVRSTPISQAFGLTDEGIIKERTPMDVSESIDNGAQATKSPPKIVNASPSPNIVPVTVTVTATAPMTEADEKKEDEDVKEKESDKKGKKKENYMMQIMRERKERYIALYKKRLLRIYKVYQPTKLEKVTAFIERYGFDVDKLHGLYKKICEKYKLCACDKYEGSLHEPEPRDDESEKALKKAGTPPNRQEKTPKQTLKHNLNDDERGNGNEKKKEFVFKFNDNNNEKKEEKVANNGWDFGNVNKDKADVIKPTFGSAQKPFDAQKDNKPNVFLWGGKNNSNVKKSDNNKNKSEPIKAMVMNTNGSNGWKPRINDVSGSANKANTKNGADLFSKPAMDFSIPAGFKFNDKKEEKKDVKINDNAAAAAATATNVQWNNGFKFGGSSDDNNKQKAVLTAPATQSANNQNNNTINSNKAWGFSNNNNDKKKSANNSFSWDNNAKKNENKQNNSFVNTSFSSNKQNDNKQNNNGAFSWNNNANKQNNLFANTSANTSFSSNKPNDSKQNNNNNGFSWNNNNANKNNNNLNSKPNKSFGTPAFSNNNNNKQNNSFSRNNNGNGNKPNNNPFANTFGAPNTNKNSNKNTNTNWDSNKSPFGNSNGNKNGFPSGGANNSWPANGNGNGNGNGNSAFSINNNTRNNSGNGGGSNWSFNSNNSGGNNNNGGNNNGGNGAFTFQRTDGNSAKMNVNKDNGNGSGFFTSNNTKKKRPVFKATRRLKK